MFPWPFPFEWDWLRSFALGENFPVVVLPSHQHCASSSQPALVTSWLDSLGWRPDPGSC